MVGVGLDHKKVDQLRAVTALLTSTPVDPRKYFGKILNFKILNRMRKIQKDSVTRRNTKIQKHFGKNKIPKIQIKRSTICKLRQPLTYAPVVPPSDDFCKIHN